MLWASKCKLSLISNDLGLLSLRNLETIQGFFTTNVLLQLATFSWNENRVFCLSRSKFVWKQMNYYYASVLLSKLTSNSSRFLSQQAKKFSKHFEFKDKDIERSSGIETKNNAIKFSSTRKWLSWILMLKVYLLPQISSIKTDRSTSLKMTCCLILIFKTFIFKHLLIFMKL